MPDIRFDDRVALITGAGGGLGRQHALELARRGASIIVNDLGGSVDGDGGDSTAARAVVAEIEAMGGKAVANGASVTDESAVAQMMDDAITAFGRIDIVIANAGILRDRSFAKMSSGDIDQVLDVHLRGTFNPIHAAWNHMRTRNYGRILVTTSSTGLYGNFGQANYGAAKLGVVGLMNTLKIEGAKYNIRVNAICPVAATRMTEDLMPRDRLDNLRPEYVTPGVVNLVKEDAPTGMILSAGAGAFSMAQIVETKGVFVGQGHELTAEAVASKWDAITRTDTQTHFDTGAGHGQNIFARLSEAGHDLQKDAGNAQPARPGTRDN